MQTVLLADTISEPIPNSGGSLAIIVEHATIFSAEVLLVGQQTYWNAQVSNIILDFSIKCRKNLYKNEKFIWFNNKLYEVVNLGKAKNVNDIILNIRAKSDKATSDAIILWLEAR